MDILNLGPGLADRLRRELIEIAKPDFVRLRRGSFLERNGRDGANRFRRCEDGDSIGRQRRLINSNPVDLPVET